MSNAINSKSVPLTSIFDPYISGTTKARASGIDDAGTDTSNLYANIIYGSAAAATGIDSESADLNTLYAAKGTAQYALPINGNTYTSLVNVTGSPTHATISFSISGGATWAIKGASGVLASGNVPTGASTVKYAWGTYMIGSGFADAGGSTVNGAASAISVSSNPAATYITADNSSNSGSRNREYPFTVDFYNGSGTNISHSVCTMVGETEGSL